MLAIFVKPVSSLGGGSLSPTLEPEAAGVHLQDVELVAEAVQQCPSELLRPESLDQLVEENVVVARVEPCS